MPHLPPSFVSKKHKILSQLAIPDSEYDDLSPKGSVDVGIRELIDEINEQQGWVTTSSCAGRVSVYLDGARGPQDRSNTLKNGEGIQGTEADGEAEYETEERKVGGKGGGRWLFVSHDPVSTKNLGQENSFHELFGLRNGETGEQLASTSPLTMNARLIHFKFEPMILHVLTASPKHAQSILSPALQAGFRESGALNITPPTTSSEAVTPMVGIRSMGLGLESIIGVEIDGEMRALVPEWQLRWLMSIANERFKENERRIARFRELLRTQEQGGAKKKDSEGKEWEDKDVRRERMRREGKARAEEMRKQKGDVGINEAECSKSEEPDISGLGI